MNTMSRLPSHPDYDRRGRWLKLMAVGWLLAVSMLTVFNTVTVSHQDARSQVTLQARRAQVLATQLADLVQQVDTLKRQPAPATQAELAENRRALEVRIARIEQAQAASPKAKALTALQSRLDTLESRQAQGQAAQASSVVSAPKPTAPIKRAPPLPPFRVVGVELRGAEQFLSVMPRGATTLADVRLLRVGASEGAWRLLAIAEHEAVFRVNGAKRRVALP